MENRWKALAVLTLARTSLGFQVQSVGSVSPVLLPDLGLDYVALGALIGLYFLPGLVLTIPAGLRSCTRLKSLLRLGLGDEPT